MDLDAATLEHLQGLLVAAKEDCMRGAHQEGASLALQAEALAAALGEVRLEAQAQALQALHLVRLGDPEGAVACSVRALGTLGAEGPSAALSRAHSTLSLAYERAGLQGMALDHGATALATARACGDVAAECWALNRLGTATDDSDGRCQGKQLLRQAVALAEALDDEGERTWALNSALNNLSRRCVLEADRLGGAEGAQALEEALPLAEAAARLASGGLSNYLQATASANLGGIHRRAGRADLARQHFRHARALAHSQGYAGLQATLDLALASLAFETERGPDSESALERQLECTARLADPDLRLQARRALLLHCVARADLAGASRHRERLQAEEATTADQRVRLQQRLLNSRAEAELALERARRPPRPGT